MRFHCEKNFFLIGAILDIITEQGVQHDGLIYIYFEVIDTTCSANIHLLINTWPLNDARVEIASKVVPPLSSQKSTYNFTVGLHIYGSASVD